MKNLKSVFIAGIALVAVFSMAALGGCAPDPQDFTFECEQMIIEGSGQGSAGASPATVETGPLYDSEEEGTFVGTFSDAGSTLTFTVTSDYECDATITLYAASAKSGMDMSGVDWNDPTTYGNMKIWLDAIDLEEVTADGATVSITNNGGAPVTLKGTLPGLETLDMQDTASWHYVGSGSGTIHLVKGENKIVIEHVESIGINYDKVVINAAANLTWTPTENE